MRRTLLVLGTILSILVAACGPASTSAGPSAGASAAPPAQSAGASPGASAAAGWDPASITGTAILSGWQSSADEGEALTQALLGFNPHSTRTSQVDYQPIAGDYRTVMITKISTGEVPDLFYVNADYAPEWIDQGFLEPLDDYIAKSGFDTSQFFEGYAVDLQGQGREDLRLPEGRQHDRDGLQQRPRDGRRRRPWTSWSPRPTALKGTGRPRPPRCASTRVSTEVSPSCMRRVASC